MQKLLPYLRLCRFANVFTALADIFLGYLLTHQSLAHKLEFGLLLATSAALYMAGMVFNDVFDREVDLRERPNRPIPSGAVSLKMAIGLGSVLIMAGIGAAAAVGTNSLLVAAALVACIFAYDGLLKSTVLGPIAMGGCRFLNVMLGASAVDPVWVLPQLHVAGGLGVYIAGVTWFARREAGASSRIQLGIAMGTINMGLALLVAFVLNWPRGLQSNMNASIIIGLIALTINRRLLAAIMDPVPAKVQVAIKIMLMSLVMLDASVVWFVQADSTYAIYVVCLLVPTFLLSRLIPMT